MSQPFILNDERLMGQSNHRMPVAAKKGVEEGTTSPLIFLSLGDCEGNVPGHSKRARTCLACRRDYLLYFF